MFALIILIVFEYIIGYLIESQRKKDKIKYGEYTYRVHMLIYLAGTVFILFSGLRNSYNDTGTYIQEYKYFTNTNIKIEPLKLLKESYYGFYVYRSIIKMIFKANYHWYFMITAIIVNVVYMKEFAKHAVHMELVMICYIILDPYMLSNAAVKQILAMAIAIFAVEALLKNKYKLFYIYLILAYTFHPYILVLLIVPFLKGDVWSKKMCTIFIISIFASMLFAKLIGIFLQLTESIGKNYEMSEMLDHTINPIRVVADFGPVVLSYIYKEKINEKGNDFYKLAINMYVMFAILSFASLFGNPIYIHRTGQYFALFTPLIVPWILMECIPKNRYKNILVKIYLSAYMGMFCLDIIQMYIPKYGFFYDFFRHVSILKLFE